MPSVDSTVSFVESKGFGWILEVDEDDPELYARPLLEELDIHPRQIVPKILSVLSVYDIAKVRDTIASEGDFWGPFFVIAAFAAESMWGQLAAASYLFYYWLGGSFVISVLLHVFVVAPIDTSEAALEAAEAGAAAPLPALDDSPKDAAAAVTYPPADHPVAAFVAGGGFFATLAILGYATAPLVVALVVGILVSGILVDPTTFMHACRVRGYHFPTHSCVHAST